MSAIRKSRIITSSMAAACFILGSAIYILFRPTTLLMFYWANALNLTHFVQIIRTSVSWLEKLIPAWIVYSLPFALWLLAYLFFIELIWAHSQFWARFVWFWCAPLIAICTELAQLCQLIPGRFDWGDLIAIILATALGFFTTSIHNVKRGKREI